MEDILVTGIIRGSIIHVHRARTVIVDNDGAITASELGHDVQALLAFASDFSFFGFLFSWALLIILTLLLC